MIACHADHIGSLLRPPELISAREDAASGRISRACACLNGVMECRIRHHVDFSRPEAPAVGWLRNQRILASLDEIAAVPEQT